MERTKCSGHQPCEDHGTGPREKNFPQLGRDSRMNCTGAVLHLAMPARPGMSTTKTPASGPGPSVAAAQWPRHHLDQELRTPDLMEADEIKIR